MTETTTASPSERRYTGAWRDAIQAWEHGTDIFTDTELDAIDRYRNRTEAIPDCIPGWSPEEVHGIGVSEIRAYFDMLNDWREAISTLGDDLTFHGSGRPYTTTAAADRYLRHELAAWRNAREEYRAYVILRMVGRDTWGEPYDRPRLEG